MKLPIFKGTGAEDPEQHWFLCEAMWTIKKINDDNLKLVQLVTTLRDRALTWYIKYTTLPKTLSQVKNAMIKEFKNLSLSLNALQSLRILSSCHQSQYGTLTRNSKLL